MKVESPGFLLFDQIEGSFQLPDDNDSAIFSLAGMFAGYCAKLMTGNSIRMAEKKFSFVIVLIILAFWLILHLFGIPLNFILNRLWLISDLAPLIYSTQLFED